MPILGRPNQSRYSVRLATVVVSAREADRDAQRHGRPGPKPDIYLTDLNIDAAAGKGNVVGLSAPKEHQVRMVDTLAAQIRWRETDGYLRFCHKIIKAPRPRNSREVTTLRLASNPSSPSRQINQRKRRLISPPILVYLQCGNSPIL